jgi:hypothetical protein
MIQILYIIEIYTLQVGNKRNSNDGQLLTFAYLYALLCTELKDER